MAQYDKLNLLILTGIAVGLSATYWFHATGKTMIASVADMPLYWVLIFLVMNIFTIYISMPMIFAEFGIKKMQAPPKI